jgi:hypothetical protein
MELKFNARFKAVAFLGQALNLSPQHVSGRLLNNFPGHKRVARQPADCGWEACVTIATQSQPQCDLPSGFQGN